MNINWSKVLTFLLQFGVLLIIYKLLGFEVAILIAFANLIMEVTFINS